MARREEYESKVEAWLLPLLEKNQFELVDVEYVREAGIWYLRAYIDKEGGITVDDCEVVSRELGDWLDQKDFIEDSYILEVSSPGLGRPLKKEKDFARSLGRSEALPPNQQTEGIYRNPESIRCRYSDAFHGRWKRPGACQVRYRVNTSGL